jgi:hypothetical protein
MYWRVCAIVLRLCGSAAVALTAGGSPWQAWAGPTSIHKIVLFSPEEARHLRLTFDEWRHLPRTRALSVGPQIVVRRPLLIAREVPTIETRSPTDLDVMFEPRQAPVRMDSLNVEARKGFFSKSLTDLLRPYIRGDWIEVTNLEIPSGRFVLDVSIADTNGNTTAASYLLEVR